MGNKRKKLPTERRTKEWKKEETNKSAMTRKLPGNIKDTLEQMDSNPEVLDEDWNNPYKCRYCSQRYHWNQDRDSHEISCQDFVELCENCSEMFTVSKQFLSHRGRCQKLGVSSTIN